MSPYIVTTTPREPEGWDDDADFKPSRRAVATLDDPRDDVETVRSHCRAIVREHGGNVDALDTITELPEQGGSVSLPDGTVIEVRAIASARELLRDFNYAPWDPQDAASIIAAYNAAQERTNG